jgi:hypothetical protein
MSPSKDAAFTRAIAYGLKVLNNIPRKEGVRALTARHLLTRDKAKKLMEGVKDLECWGDESIFIRTSVAKKWFAGLTDAGKTMVIEGEIFGGWYARCASDGDEDVDNENEWCSTACLMDEENDGFDPDCFEEQLNDVAHAGVVFIY